LNASTIGTAEPVPARAGIGLRHDHHREVLATRPRVGWLEVHSENFLAGAAQRMLETLRRDYPISLHGVGLSLGTDAPLDGEHLARIKALTERIEPCLVSEHVSWSTSGGVYLNDLLPLPYTSEALDVMCRHVDVTQHALGRRILVENPSSYLTFAHSTIPECEFIAEIARRTGCGLLLDVNNVYVSACNHGFDAQRYIAALPAVAVQEIHLAGHAVKPIGDVTLRIDDHGSAVCDEVWTLYRDTVRTIGPRPTLIEWDCDIPALPVLLAEAAKADAILTESPAGTDAAHDAAA
jgi:uncharacterized protein (UPF0276 family)